jgi:hypothetical protein
MPQPAVDVEATLATTHRLLNNPPSTHASPSATEQWHHDIDQLIVAAMNTPHHEGGWQEASVAHSCSPSAPRAPPYKRVPHQPHMPPSIAMADLHNELILHRSGSIVTSPSSATVKGAATSRAATSSEILNLLRLHEKFLRCMPYAPQAPQ